MNVESRRGRFITLEGLEGVGKSTAATALATLIRSADRELVLTREPGGTPLGESLRKLVLHGDEPVEAGTELLLMAASRLELTRKVIAPALASGKWVLSDRYIDASAAYQGGGRQLGVATVKALHELLQISIRPDLTLLLDMPVEMGLQRMSARGTPDRIEKETHAFFERARAAYLERAAEDPERIRIIDASQSIEGVRQQIEHAMSALLG